MGVSINNVSVKELKDGIDFLLTCENVDNKPCPSIPVAVRTRDGIDGHFYLDYEDGKMLITPSAYYVRKPDPEKEFCNKVTIELSKKPGDVNLIVGDIIAVLEKTGRKDLVKQLIDRTCKAKTFGDFLDVCREYVKLEII